MRRFLGPGLELACLVGLLLVCFGSVLVQNRQLSYRDAAHFYYPLYQRVQQEWEAGRLPLWEPEENAGMPLLGNPTAAVLYPGKVIFALLPYPWAAKLYIISHVPLAALTMLLLMRHWGVSRTGSVLAAISYAFGMPVLFQYCNVVFLVGAAWAPLGLRGCDRWLRQSRRWGLVELVFVLVMQTLGGDPEAAYLVGLCGGAYALLISARGENRPSRLGRTLVWGGLALVAWVGLTLLAARFLPAQYRSLATGGVRRTEADLLTLVSSFRFWVQDVRRFVLSPRLWKTVILAAWGLSGLILVARWIRAGRSDLGRRWAGLGIAAIVAGAVMGLQLLPTIEFTNLTIRAAEDGGHELFPFSLEPHRLMELFWPSPFGTMMPTTRSWAELLMPGRLYRIWLPSLYLGAVTIVLAWNASGGPRTQPWRAWLWALLLVSLLGSLGECGSPVWLARNVKGGPAVFGPHDVPHEGENRRDGELADGFGSPYWLMARILPGFGSFRYPSKLLVFTSLAFSGLAGIGWDRVVAGRKRRALALAVSLAAIGTIALAATFPGREHLLSWWQRQNTQRGSSVFGPFDPVGALSDTRLALVHGSLVLVAFVLILRWSRCRPGLAGSLLVVLMAADLAIANGRYVVSCAQSVFDSKPEVIARIEDAERHEGSTQPYRIHRAPIWEPPAWHLSGASERLDEFTRWERQTAQPKYAIPYHTNYTLTEGTTELYDFWFFFAPFFGNPREELKRSMNLGPGQSLIYYPRRGYDLWNTKYFVLPLVARNDEERAIYSFLPETEAVYPPERKSGPLEEDRMRWGREQDWQILRNKNAWPRAWVVHEARFLTPIQGMNKVPRQPPMEEILYQADDLWFGPSRIQYDPHRIAWIEVEDQASIIPYLPGGPAVALETPTITRYEPQRVEIDVTLDRPGVLVLADVFYPGWRLTVDGKSAPILRANRLMRGAALASGRHQLAFVYRPDSVRVGLELSVAGLIGLAAFCLWSAFQRGAPITTGLLTPGNETGSPGSSPGAA